MAAGCGWGCGTRFCLDARNYHRGSGPEGVTVNGRRRQKCQKQKRRLRDDESGTKEMDANLEARGENKPRRLREKTRGGRRRAPRRNGSDAIFVTALRSPRWQIKTRDASRSNCLPLKAAALVPPSQNILTAQVNSSRGKKGVFFSDRSLRWAIAPANLEQPYKRRYVWHHSVWRLDEND